MAETSPERQGVAAEANDAALIDIALRYGSYRLRFPPELEARFERDTGPERCRTFVGHGTLGLALCYLFLPSYFSMLPDVAWRELLVEVGFVTPAAVGLIAYMRTKPPAFWRETSQTLVAVLSLVASMVAYHASTLPNAVFFRYAPILTALFINAVVAVRFRYAAAGSIAVVLCNFADLWLFPGASPDAKQMVANAVIMTCLFTLLANHRLEKGQRRTYLLNARERLLREEAARLADAQSHDALHRAQEREQAALAAAAHAAELRDAHRVARIGTWRRDLVNGTLALSEELHHLLGTDPQTFDPTTENLLSLIRPEDRTATGAALARAASGERAGEYEWRVLRPDGSLAWFWAETRLETDASGRTVAVRGVCQDVTEHRATAERIYRLAHHDALTGLANRALLRERINEATARARRAESNLAVLCLDLDGFKAVNDLYGHAAGDRLLREVAARLIRSVRETDTVARLGGDEFVVLQTEHVQPEAARALAERIVATLAEPYDLGAGEAQGAVTASVGVAVFPADGDEPETLLHNADTALYRAKWAGKNGAAFFRPEMDHELRERRSLESDLRQAVGCGEFRLAWQQLSAADDDGRVTGFEALLRWHDPERGLVPPDVFIPVAEACGAIAVIGAWVLREACHEAARWAQPLRVAVNVSPLQAQQGEVFAEVVEQALASSGLAPSRLILEVTEGVLIREPDRVLAALRRLKVLGVQVALDDFGTGYSSLGTLRAFPFDKIKIDRSFVAGLNTEAGEQDAAIVRAVLGLARGLGLPVTAEGVETAAQLGVLRAAGCNEVQGWLVGRPAPIESFAHLTGPRDAASATGTRGATCATGPRDAACATGTRDAACARHRDSGELVR